MNPTEVFMKSGKNIFSAKNVAYFAILLALVIVLQACSGYMKIGTTSFCLVLVPIVLGGMLLGVCAATLLGLVFGAVVLVDAACGLDPFTLLLLNESPFFTVFLCLFKGAMAGLVSSLLFKLISKKNSYVAAFVASFAAPVVNTGIFVIGAFCSLELISNVFNNLQMSVAGLSPVYIVFVLCVGVNFFVELALNLVCAPALFTVEKVVSKRVRSKG